MKVLLLNGSPHQAGCTYTALDEVAKQLGTHSIDAEIAHYKALTVQECAARIKDADGLVVGSPVYYASINGELGALLDKAFGASGDFRGKPAAGVVSCRRGGAGSAFDRLNKYFTICGMPVVSSCYWNAVHGNTPDEVRQDVEGLRIMRVLADNMAWLLKCIAAGTTAGVALPPLPPPERTNFIR